MEDQELILPAGHVSMMMNPVISQSAQVRVRPSDDHFPAEDPSPKRQKFDKSSLPSLPVMSYFSLLSFGSLYLMVMDSHIFSRMLMIQSGPNDNDDQVI